jgi:hypothetical protein
MNDDPRSTRDAGASRGWTGAPGPDDPTLPYAPGWNAPSPGQYAPAPYDQPPYGSRPYAQQPFAEPPRPYAYPPDSRAAWDPAPADDAPPGRPLVTPFRLFAVIAMIASTAVAGYGLIVARGSQSIPLTVAALAVFAIASALLGFSFAGGAFEAGRSGRLVRAVVGSLVGGGLCLAAAGAAAAAIILGMLSRS